VLSTVVHGISPFDIPALGAAAGLLVVVGLLCGLVPARRAMLVDPMTVIRQE
jgi:hypothetical protein